MNVVRQSSTVINPACLSDIDVAGRSDIDVAGRSDIDVAGRLIHIIKNPRLGFAEKQFA
ncbi:MAG: hypothetical protein KKB77_09030 [Bacteroidetes bacterium]|nr:hypothetical protein [Bacteroidota bacterium]